MDLTEPNFSPKETNKYQLKLDVYKCIIDALEELGRLGKIFLGQP